MQQTADAVTGATVTSNGVMDAAAKAIEAAKGNANTAAKKLLCQLLPLFKRV